jgi:hypothetical protein
LQDGAIDFRDYAMFCHLATEPANREDTVRFAFQVHLFFFFFFVAPLIMDQSQTVCFLFNKIVGLLTNKRFSFQHFKNKCSGYACSYLMLETKGG